MVDAEQVVDAQRVAHPLDPPGVSRLFMIGPIVQRVAPQLAVGGKIIRRAAGHPGKTALGVQLKQGPAHPGIHRIGGDVDGDIAQNFHALGVGVGLDLFPLEGKLVLQKFPEADLLLLLGPERCQSARVPQAVLPGPLGPALHLMRGLEGHVEGVILQPALVGQREGVVIVREIMGAAVPAGALFAPGRIGGAQNFIAAGVEGAVIHLQRVLAPIFRPELGGGEQTVRLQGVKVDEIRVARKGGAALVGAVAVAGGAQRQDLPDLLARSGEKINELFSFLSEAANSIRAGQAGHRHQDSTFTHGFTFLTFHILTGNLLILIIT